MEMGNTVTLMVVALIQDIKVGKIEPETEQNDGGEPCSLNSESLVKDRVSMQES